MARQALDLQPDFEPSQWRTPLRTDEDHQVWRLMSDRICTAMAHSGWHSPVYEARARQICTWREALPDLPQINAWLEPTGWRAVSVEGYVPTRSYQELQSQGLFPICGSLRSLGELDHSPSPDFVHDLFGHLPMLFEPRYSDLVRAWAERGRHAVASAADRAAALAGAHLAAALRSQPPNRREVAGRTAALARAQAEAARGQSRFWRFTTFYAWAVEFGVLQERGRRRTLIGAAALSSPGEMRRIFGGHVAFEAFRTGAVGRAVDDTRYQQRLFVADSYDQYFDALREI